MAGGVTGTPSLSARSQQRGLASPWSSTWLCPGTCPRWRHCKHEEVLEAAPAH